MWPNGLCTMHNCASTLKLCVLLLFSIQCRCHKLNEYFQSISRYQVIIVIIIIAPSSSSSPYYFHPIPHFVHFSHARRAVRLTCAIVTLLLNVLCLFQGFTCTCHECAALSPIDLNKRLPPLGYIHRNIEGLRMRMQEIALNAHTMSCWWLWLPSKFTWITSGVLVAFERYPHKFSLP